MSLIQRYQDRIDSITKRMKVRGINDRGDDDDDDAVLRNNKTVLNQFETKWSNDRISKVKRWVAERPR